MFTKNIIILLLLIGIAFLVLYIYYDNIDSTKVKKSTQKKINKLPSPRKVHFNDYVEERYYVNDQPDSDSMPALEPVDNIGANNNILVEIDDDLGTYGGDKLNSNNFDPDTKNTDTWDSSFGLPLMNPDEKKRFFEKMQQNHKKFGQSMDEFTAYKTDRSTIIKTETTIDPFKPDHRSEFLQGKPISDIYDSQVSTIKAKPKNVKKKTSNQIIYEEESELNGGHINGTSLYGFDGVVDDYKTAAFGNEF